MTSGRITELRLTAFKSYRDVVMPLSPLTVLIGRNGSGKSNALDALEILSRLARGVDVRDALEGDRGGTGPIRGGLEGCVPHGSDRFTIGVTLETEASEKIWLDVTIRVSPQPQIVAETLHGYVRGGRWLRTLLESQAADPHRSDLDAAIWNNKKGPNPRLTFRGSHLLSAQLPLRLGGKDTAEREVLEVVRSALAVLGGVFQLDPVPHLMRTYVPEKDSELRRTADNLSAAVARLKETDPNNFRRLVETVKNLPEYEVHDLEVGRGSYGDVMIALIEGQYGAPATMPARQMSDGMLRMLAITTTLLTGGGGVDIGGALGADTGPLVLVIEELENGLHPTQAGALLALIREASQQQEYQVLLTTHSPALLNALAGADHRGVLIVSRERGTAATLVTPLVDLPGYQRLLAGHRLGDATAEGRLSTASAPPRPPTEAELDDLLGLS